MTVINLQGLLLAGKCQSVFDNKNHMTQEGHRTICATLSTCVCLYYLFIYLFLLTGIAQHTCSGGLSMHSKL